MMTREHRLKRRTRLSRLPKPRANALTKTQRLGTMSSWGDERCQSERSLIWNEASNG